MIGDSPANQVWWHMMTPEGSLKSMQEVYGATLPTAISDDPPNGNHWKYGVDWFRSDMRNKIMWKVLVTCDFRRFPVESHLDSRKRFCLQNSTLQNCIELSVASRENNQNSSWPNHHTLGLNIHSARRWCKFDHRRQGVGKAELCNIHVGYWAILFLWVCSRLNTIFRNIPMIRQLLGAHSYPSTRPNFRNPARIWSSSGSMHTRIAFE